MTVNTSLLQQGYQSLVQQRFFELPCHKIVISHRIYLISAKRHVLFSRMQPYKHIWETAVLSGNCSGAAAVQILSPACLIFKKNSAAVTMRTCCILVYRGNFYVTFLLFSCYVHLCFINWELMQIDYSHNCNQEWLTTSSFCVSNQ